MRGREAPQLLDAAEIAGKSLEISVAYQKAPQGAIRGAARGASVEPKATGAVSDCDP
jgi:hypothetical protein